MRDGGSPCGLGIGEVSVISINELSRRASVRVKSWLPEHCSGARAVDLDGQRMPAVGATAAAGEFRVLGLAPGEWLVVSDHADGAKIQEVLQSGLEGECFALVDLSDGLLGLRMQDRAVRDILSRSCGLDLHPQLFPAGRCARTRFAQLPVTLDCRDDPQVFELYVARSYASWLRSWLIDSAAEEGSSGT